MIGVLLKNKDGSLQLDEDKNVYTPVSPYQPPEDVRVITEHVSRDYQVGFDLHHRPFEEFNDSSLLRRLDIDCLQRCKTSEVLVV